ncbi:MAG: lytic murein transglycosylase, partial [Tardiphaga sp.]|nr:lytic murein transglycosylase [Tardiphaga sp.]
MEARDEAGHDGERPALMLRMSLRMRSTIISIAALAITGLASPASAQFAPPIQARPTTPTAGAAATVRPAITASPRAAACHGGQSFDQFLVSLKQQATAAGVSSRAIAASSPWLVYDPKIVNRDRGQRVFGQLFTEFARRMAADYRMQNGQLKIKAHAAAFARAEKQYGVPPAVIAAFWALESDFGAQMGNLPTLPSLVSLAYDCRRSKMFQDETIAALKIIDRGDLAPEEMIGSWAGELGQTQFLPTHYFNYAVDYDGDGHRNLLRSPDDVIGSTANYIANGLKWRRGEPWLQEVRVPASSFPWDQADLTVQL